MLYWLPVSVISDFIKNPQHGMFIVIILRDYRELVGCWQSHLYYYLCSLILVGLLGVFSVSVLL